MKKYIHALLLVATIGYVQSSSALDLSDSGAVGVKTLIFDALKNGQAEGIVEGNVSTVFQSGTHSNEPVHMKLTRIKQYSAGCGRLRFEMIQAGVKGKDGKLVTVNPAFELSICPNGQAPKEVREELEQHRREGLKHCKALTERGSLNKKTGMTSGVIKITGAPASGKVQLKYTGSCPAIQMPTGRVINYPIDKDGKLNIQLQLPLQCTTDKPAQQNQWSLIMIEQGGFVLGDVVTAW